MSIIEQQIESLPELPDLQDEQHLRRREARLWRALGKSEIRRGPDDLGRVEILSRLSSLVLSQHRFAEAEALARRALQIFEHNLGPDDPGLVISLVYLFHILKRQDKFADAEETLRRGLDITEGAQGPLERDQAKVVEALATLLQQGTRQEEARDVYRRAVAILDERGAASDDPELIGVLSSMGRTCNGTGCYVEALALFRHSLTLCESMGKASGDVPKEALAAIGQGLGAALGLCAYEHMDRREFAQALVLAQEMRQYQPRLGYLLIVEIFTNTDRHEEALLALKEGTARLPGEATLWRMLGDAHYKAGQLTDAEAAYRRALALPGTDPDGALTRYNLAVILNMQRRGDETLDLLRDIRREDLGEERQDLYWNTRSSLMEVLALMHREDELSLLATQVLRELTEDGHNGRPSEGSVASLICLSRALFYGRGDRIAAQACAHQAFRIQPDQASAALLRELSGETNEGIYQARSRMPPREKE